VRHRASNNTARGLVAPALSTAACPVCPALAAQRRQDPVESWNQNAVRDTSGPANPLTAPSATDCIVGPAFVNFGNNVRCQWMTFARAAVNCPRGSNCELAVGCRRAQSTGMLPTPPNPRKATRLAAIQFVSPSLAYPAGSRVCRGYASPRRESSPGQPHARSSRW
jgi:hypothetical protein